LAMRLGLKRMPLRGNDLAREGLKNHWAYGRWSIANEALNWVPMNIYYLMLPLWGGLAAGAYLKALMNLIMPMSQAIWALSILLLPVLVRARGEDRAGTGHARFNSRVRLALVPFVLGPLLYWLLLGLFNHPLVSWLYDGRYTEHAALLWILGLSPVVASVKQVMGQSLRALERPDQLFWAYTLSATVTLTFGTGLVYIWGVVGATIGFLVSQAITAALALVLLKRLESSQRQAAMETPTSASALATRVPEARKT
jgi:O-antigen/teichoic acid export membrane protein